MADKILYAEMLPREFTAAIKKAPVAYLPLGTLEWHGPHLPLGSDGLQAAGLFERIAREAGGVVCPMLFVGPDRFMQGDKLTYYGMDVCTESRSSRYENQKLPGSAYWVPRGTFFNLIDGILAQLSRAGVKIVVAHGHGPSTLFVIHEREFFETAYSIKLLTCWEGYDGGDGFQSDHAAANETSIVLGLRPDLVDMSMLPSDPNEWPLAIGGRDPRLHASEAYGESILRLHTERMAGIIKNLLV